MVRVGRGSRIGAERAPEKAEELAKMLSEGRWTHDYAITYDDAKEFVLQQVAAVGSGYREPA